MTLPADSLYLKLNSQERDLAIKIIEHGKKLFKEHARIDFRFKGGGVQNIRTFKRMLERDFRQDFKASIEIMFTNNEIVIVAEKGD